MCLKGLVPAMFSSSKPFYIGKWVCRVAYVESTDSLILALTVVYLLCVISLHMYISLYTGY